MTVGTKEIDFLIDTGATHLVLNTKLTKKSLAAMLAAVVTIKLQKQAFLQPLESPLGDQNLTHSFLYMPDCPSLLFCKDLFCKFRVQITFSPEKQQLRLEVLPEHVIHLQVLLACLKEPRGKLTHPRSRSRLIELFRLTESQEGG